jgi:Sec-independent protein translocase protein TatA
MSFGTRSEILFVVILAVLIVVGTKIGAIGSTVGGWLGRKR